jgi:hypothetical protein
MTLSFTGEAGKCRSAAQTKRSHQSFEATSARTASSSHTPERIPNMSTANKQKCLKKADQKYDTEEKADQKYDTRGVVS